MAAFSWRTEFTAEELAFYKANCYVKQPTISPGGSETIFDDMQTQPTDLT